MEQGRNYLFSGAIKTADRSTHSVVITGLDPVIHAFNCETEERWMAGSSPAMTVVYVEVPRPPFVRRSTNHTPGIQLP
jgi:hypothetical protein